MNVTSAETEYAAALLFAAEVTDAATRPGYGHHGEERLRDPYARELLGRQGSWALCDSRQDVDMAAAGPLEATVGYLARRAALAPWSLAGRPHELWPDLEARLGALAEALEFAATCAEEARPHLLGAALKAWLRHRLAELLRAPAPGASLGGFEARVRRAVTVTHRYRIVRYELFGDRHWQGRPEAPWWCPDLDLAARSPFQGHATGEMPAYLLRLAGTAGELTVATRPGEPARTYTFTVSGGVAHLGAEHREAARAGLAALGCRQLP
jgi:hypothetical protein